MSRRLRTRLAFVPVAVLLAVLALGATGCQLRTKMYDQAKYEPYERSELFDDGAAARPFPDGTVARGRLNADRVLHTGMLPSGEFVVDNPLDVTPELLARGRERFDVFCSVCHGRTGAGDGMVVQRGYRVPASYHQQRLRTMPDGYFFDVITRGFGQMPSYATMVPVEDRWAIVAYVRALQLAHNARLAELPPEVRERAETALAAAERAAAEPAGDDDTHDTHDSSGH